MLNKPDSPKAMLGQARPCELTLVLFTCLPQTEFSEGAQICIWVEEFELGKTKAKGTPNLELWQTVEQTKEKFRWCWFRPTQWNSQQDDPK
jgi:hypothetical protein